jgi:hypothetical protein
MIPEVEAPPAAENTERSRVTAGTAGVLELVQYFAGEKKRSRRSLIFMAFSGEELGLLGSAYYTNHPPFPLERTTAMINMDMIGRMQDSALVVEGIGTSPQWQPLVERLSQPYHFRLALKKDGEDQAIIRVL